MKEIEIEFKNMLTVNEYERLLNHTPEYVSHTIQTNHYFETPSLELKNQHAALRIRVKDDTYTLTLKMSKHEHNVEVHETINQDSYQQMIAGEIELPASIALELQPLSEPLHYVGALITERYEWKIGDHIFALDKNRHNGTTDYELEMESTDFKQGETYFFQFLNEHAIQRRPAETKIARFYQSREN